MKNKGCCQCEHSAHTDGDMTPNGNPGHKYNQNFFDTYLTKVETPYGIFQVCRDCAKDCYGTCLS